MGLTFREIGQRFVYSTFCENLKNWAKPITPRRLRRTLRHMYGGYSKVDAFAKAFHYRQDDVVIVSYPRSGSTWLRFIFAHLIRDRVSDQSTNVDFLFVQRFIPAISAAIQQKGVDYEALPFPRIMRTHSLYIKEIPKVIYLMRDGRDVLVSY